jgi:hypothetical protein
MDMCTARGDITTDHRGLSHMGGKVMRALASSMKSALLIAAGSALLLTACQREPNLAPQVSGASHRTDIPVQIENFSLGTRLGPNGGIATGAGEHMFEAGQLIYIAMELKNAPVGTPVSVLWKGPGDTVLGQETKTVRRGQRFMNFAADSGALPVAPKYRVEVLVDGKTITQLEFDLILASA